MQTYWVYIITGRTRTLYVGVTNDLERRVAEHKDGAVAGFTSKYSLDRLVYCEEHSDVRVAIEREKQIKRWRREKKVALIESANSEWKDLSLDRTRRKEGKSLRVDPSAALADSLRSG